MSDALKGFTFNRVLEEFSVFGDRSKKLKCVVINKKIVKFNTLDGNTVEFFLGVYSRVGDRRILVRFVDKTWHGLSLDTFKEIETDFENQPLYTFFGPGTL